LICSKYLTSYSAMEGLEGTEAIWEGETIQDCRRFRGMIDGVVREAIKTKELKLTNLKADKRIAAVRGNVCVMEQVNQSTGYGDQNILWFIVPHAVENNS